MPQPDAAAPATAPPHAWRRVGEPAATPAPEEQPQEATANTVQEPPPDSSNYQLTIPRGTFITVRIDQALSSDRNQIGDAFSATLAKPIVVNGLIVAQTGQTLAGRVVEARKAGHVEGVSRLGIELTDLTLVDGQQFPIQSELISRNGPTSVGRDAGVIAGTTATGAAIGAAVNGGVGAGVGAAAGIVAGMAGVLLTRGHATVIYPESVLTFRLEAPVTFSTERSPQAFHYVSPQDYTQSEQLQTRASAPPPRDRCATYGCPPPYYYGGYWGPAYYPYYPYYWGPSFSLFYGSGFYRGFYGPRYYGGFRGGFHGGFHGRRR